MLGSKALTKQLLIAVQTEDKEEFYDCIFIAAYNEDPESVLTAARNTILFDNQNTMPDFALKCLEKLQYAFQVNSPRQLLDFRAVENCTMNRLVELVWQNPQMFH